MTVLAVRQNGAGTVDRFWNLAEVVSMAFRV